MEAEGPNPSAPNYTRRLHLPETNLKSQIETLIKLQEIDTMIYGLLAKKAQVPEQFKTLESLFEGKKAGMLELEKKSLDIAKLKKEKELELAAKEESAVKLQGQLFALKTNKEYQTMLQQIQDAKADASVIEDQILELFEKADLLKTEVEKEKIKLKEEEKVFLAQKDKVQEEVKIIDDDLSRLDGQRKQIIPLLDKKILAQYEKILSSRAGLAIVKVTGNSCGGCNMFVPPQVINLIKMYDRIITCEMCNRMLYIEDNK